MGIKELCVERWHSLACQRMFSLSAETSSRVSTLRPSAEADSIWPGQWLRWGTFTAHRPCQLPRRGWYCWAKWCSPPLGFLDCRSLAATTWQWPPTLSLTNWRSSTKNHWQAHSWHLSWTLAQKDAWPGRSSWQLDLGADETGRKTPSLVEGA